MIPPLNKLLKLINIELPKLKNAHIHILSDNKSEKVVINDNKKIQIININIPSLTPQETARLKPILKELIQDENILLEADANKLIGDFKQVDGREENRELLEYFKGKLDYRDIEILRASLYLKSVYERGESVSQLKQDIMNRYGDRGRNISNLCSAEYFTSQIKPLYEEMYAQPSFSPEEFLKIYEIIVTESPYAIFINARMTQEEVKREVLNKINLGKKYGVKYLNIHGISKDNVDKITHLLKELTPTLAQAPEITGGEKFIVVKIWF